MMDVVLGILHLGNVAFSATPLQSGKEGCEVSPQSATALAEAARLLGLGEGQLRTGLTTKVIVSPRSTIINMPRSVKEAEETRDSMAKLLYSHLMSVLIARINRALTPSSPSSSPSPSPSSPLVTIGLLDIFGFECFPVNSLEQLLINFANERLHQHFLSYVFKLEAALYAAEGVSLSSTIAFHDNQPTLDVLDKKPSGHPPPPPRRALHTEAAARPTCWRRRRRRTPYPTRPTSRRRWAARGSSAWRTTRARWSTRWRGCWTRTGAGWASSCWCCSRERAAT